MNEIQKAVAKIECVRKKLKNNNFILKSEVKDLGHRVIVFAREDENG